MKKSILFACVENAGRSQMAAAFARDMAKDTFDIYSAGSKPAQNINPEIVKAMLEKGINISGNKPKGFFDLNLKQIDYLVTMGCGDVCPIFPSIEKINWQIEDPKGKNMKEIIKIRNLIKRLVQELINKINAGSI